MTDDFLKRTRTTVQNGYGVETRPDYLADMFPIYDHTTRTKILNDWDSDRGDNGFDGDNPRDTADNMALRIKLEAVHQALRKVGR